VWRCRGRRGPWSVLLTEVVGKRMSVDMGFGEGSMVRLEVVVKVRWDARDGGSMVVR